MGYEDLMIITDSGIIIRLPLEQISSTGRVAQGVKLINLKDNQKLVQLFSRLLKQTEEEQDSENNIDTSFT